MRKKGSVGKESKARLLAAAIEEFAQHGYHEAKVSSIVARAELTQPSFYLYFQSKDAVFRELVDDFRSRLNKLVEQSRMEPGLEPEKVLPTAKGALESIFQFLAEEPNMTRIGLFLAPEAADIKAEMAAMIFANLLAEQQEGYFSVEADMGIAADCLVGIIERLTVTRLLNGKEDPEMLAMQVKDLFFYGLSPTKRDRGITYGESE